MNRRTLLLRGALLGALLPWGTHTAQAEDDGPEADGLGAEKAITLRAHRLEMMGAGARIELLAAGTSFREA